MARNINFAPGEFYHLYNRGTEKRTVFSSKTDYERFQALLYLCNGTKPVHLKKISRNKSDRGRTSVFVEEFDRGEPLVEIGAYCLMPNHFHLLLREKAERGISRFMQKLMTGYTMYFNTRNERTGALFQGKFKATHAGEDVYLKYLIAYIHLNPVKLIDPTWKESGVSNRKKTEDYLEKYQYSSYLDYLGKDRVQKVVIASGVLPEYFETPKIFRKNITEWLTHRSQIPTEITEVRPR